MDKFLNVKHTYAPANRNSYVKNYWWPDFGPSTIEFSDQYKMHPTNTIFENQIVKGAKPRQELLADAMGRGSSSSSQPPDQQFRRQPHTEALWSSTIIQPYKSGGHPKEKIEGAWNSKHRADSVAHEEAQATLLAKRTMNQQTLSAIMSPMRSMRSMSSPTVGFGNSLGGLSKNGVVDEDAPWLAQSTMTRRPMDTAGLAGGPRSRFYKDGSSELGLDPESATATVIAQTRKR